MKGHVPAWRRRLQERPRTAPAAPKRRGPRVGAAVDLSAAQRSLAAAWKRTDTTIRDMRADPDPLGHIWREAWGHQIAAWRAASDGELSADEIGSWARRLRPWIDEYTRRTRVPGVGTIWTASSLRSLVRRVNQRIRSMKNDVEAWAASVELTDEDREWLAAWRAWFQGWASWLGDNCEAEGNDPCASFGVVGDVITWGSTADEIQAYDAELDGWRDRWRELSGREPSSAADSDTARAARSGSGFFSGLLAGGASTALLGVAALIALASLRR